MTPHVAGRHPAYRRNTRNDDDPVKSLLSIAAVIGLAYLLIVALYWGMQRSLIYYPQTSSIEQARAQARALGGQPWVGNDGRWLGWKIEADDGAREGPSPRALVFHGNAGMALHRHYFAHLLSGFPASGPWTVYIFEYPGYGPRKGAPGQAAFTTAAAEAVDQLLAIDPEPLLIVGESIGSGVAADVVRQRPDAVAALLLITPFDTMANLARFHMPYLPTGLLLKDRYDNRDALKRFEKPLVVVTAGKDRIVPAVMAEPLLRQHAGPVLHETQAAAGHNTLHFNPSQPPWPAIDGFLAVD